LNIFVTNDDGVTSLGLLALAQAMRNLGTVSVLAPDRNWSGSGHVKTLDRPLGIREAILAEGSKAYTSDGAPSDCVALALLGFLEKRIDLVVSGINPVPNLGHDVTYSGTVTAAMEAVIWGVPGIAYSLDCAANQNEEIDYSPSAIISEIVAKFVLESGLPDGVLLNVNIPCGFIRGIQTTHQGMRVYRDKLDMRIDPRGNPYYWIGGESPSGIPEIGTDIGSLSLGFVSVTPLHLDLTSYPTMPLIGHLQREFNFPMHELELQKTGDL